jgi:hypothetical protein
MFVKEEEERRTREGKKERKKEEKFCHLFFFPLVFCLWVLRSSFSEVSLRL